MIIAIDGPSGTGKSTVARGVAKRLGFIFFDTGAMYRSFSWHLLQQGISPSDEKAIRQAISQFRFDIQTDSEGGKHYFVDGIEVSQQIRTQEISTLASQISTWPFVRQALVKIQREFGSTHSAVFEGRDMGTVVFPDAEVKIFLTARASVRADRRYRELLLKFPDLADSLSREQILREIEERDLADSSREISPLRQAADARLIDTSDLTAEQVIDRIVHLYSKQCKQPPFSRMRRSYRAVYLFARTLLRLFYGLRVYGLTHFRSGAGIIAANHASFLDPPVISVSCPEEVHFLARESLFRFSLFGWLIRTLNSHPVARDTSDARTFRELIQLLQRDQKVILFPEGGRTKDGRLQPLEKGLSFLVYKARCSIFPVYVDGTFAIWRRGKKIPKLWGRIRCVFGSPIEWKEFEQLEKREAMHQITLRTEEALQALQKWVYQGCRGEPP